MLIVENGLCLKYGPAFQPGGHVENAEPEMLEFQEGWTPYPCGVKVTPGRISVCTLASLGHSREQRGQSKQGAWFCPSGDREEWQFCGGKKKGQCGIWSCPCLVCCVFTPG